MERCEQTVRRTDEKDILADKMKYRIMFTLAVIFAALTVLQIVAAFSFLQTPGIMKHMIVPIIVFALLAFLFFKLKDGMLIEYDYIIEDDVLTVAKIKNLSSRKEIVNIPSNSFKRIEAFTPERYSQLDAEKYNCSLNRQNKKLLFFEKGSENCVLVFEPNEEMNKIITKELSR